MSIVDYSLALISGVFVLLSPCSYPLLPGYVAYYLGSNVGSVRALQGGLACSIGLIAVYSIIGLTSYILGNSLLKALPIAYFLAVIIIGLLGIIMLFGVDYPRIYFKFRATRRGGLLGFLLYGFTYGLASLACSAPIFISIILYASTFGDFVDGILTFLAFSLGMSLPLILTTVLVARARSLMLRRMVGATSRLQRASGLVLIALAIYLCFLSHI